MQGFIFDIKKFAMFDGPGIRTTVFLQGCPLNCWWCHNPESIRTLSQDDDSTLAGNSRRMSPDELLAEIRKDELFFDESGGGVTFSGGEPLIQAPFLRETLRLCREHGIHTAVDTSGYAPAETVEAIAEVTDLFLFDIKLVDDSDHQKYTGVSNKIILENLSRLLEMGRRTTVRIPLIPGITDTDKNLSEIAGFLASRPQVSEVDLLPFNHYAKSKYERFRKENRLAGLKTQSAAELARMARFFSGLDAKVTIRS